MFNRPKSKESDTLAKDVEAFLKRGGKIQQCETGQSAEPGLLGLARLISNQSLAAAKTKMRKMRKRAGLAGAKSRRVNG